MRRLGHHRGHDPQRRQGAARSGPGGDALNESCRAGSGRLSDDPEGARGACAASAVEQIDAHAYRLVSATPSDEIEPLCHAAELDWAWIPAGRRLTDYGLFVSDMDSTIINIECIDEVADMYGMKHDVAAITEAAMRGEINFRESLTRA